MKCLVEHLRLLKARGEPQATLQALAEDAI